VATPVELPKTGNTVEECLISRWVKHPGDAVSAGEVVAEVETDKATFEITAPVAGTMLATFFDEGALVPVFTTLCVLGAPGEPVDAFRPATVAPRTTRDLQSTIQSAIRNPQSAIDRDAPLSPRARRFAAERAFTTAGIVGSGPSGRILERDVRRAYELTRVSPVASPAPRRASGTREIIARRLRESLATTAQYTLHSWADAAGLLSLRAAITKSPGRRAPDITINDLVTFCAVRALLDIPTLNAEFVDGRIVEHADVHVGFACDTPRGLLVPVVRRAQTLSLGRLAARLKELAAQAVDGTISADNLSGGTFTISNLGALGVEAFTPVINAPQVAILGVGAIHAKPVRTNGRVEFVDAIGLSLTCDHQVVDGAPGARFLRTVKEKIENVEYDVILQS